MNIQLMVTAIGYAICLYFIYDLQREFKKQEQINRSVQGGLDTRIQLSINQIEMSLRDHKQMSANIEQANRKSQTAYEMAKTAETMANTALRDKKPTTHTHIHKHFTKKRKLKTLVPDSAMNQEMSTKYNDCF